MAWLVPHPGWPLDAGGDAGPRGMTAHDRTRLTDRLRHLPSLVLTLCSDPGVRSKGQIKGSEQRVRTKGQNKGSEQRVRTKGQNKGSEQRVRPLTLPPVWGLIRAVAVVRAAG